jgi:hypothetical protein
MSVQGYQPDFLNPAPDGPFTEIGAELARVRLTPPAKVAAELAECLGGSAALRDHPVLAGDPAAGWDPAQVRDLLADMLHRAWSALIEPWWPRLRDVLDADITYRARRLADAGLDDRPGRPHWHPGQQRERAPVGPARVRLGRHHENRPVPGAPANRAGGRAGRRVARGQLRWACGGGGGRSRSVSKA